MSKSHGCTSGGPGETKSFPSISIFSYLSDQTSHIFEQVEIGNVSDLGKQATPIVPTQFLNHAREDQDQLVPRRESGGLRIKSFSTKKAPEYKSLLATAISTISEDIKNTLSIGCKETNES
jgi:hypothetical protein